MSYDADVIIIGAGVSGLRAAAKLDAMGITYIVLEGSDYIGGRLKSTDFYGTPIEWGANWVHGASDGNPIYDIAVNKLGL
jgi:monoamine oxidase